MTIPEAVHAAKAVQNDILEAIEAMTLTCEQEPAYDRAKAQIMEVHKHISLLDFSDAAAPFLQGLKVDARQALDRFAEAAKNWGWQEDQGYNEGVIEEAKSEFDASYSALEHLLSALEPSPREQALEEEEFAIDKLRFRAFHTNSEADRQAYFDAVSKWFQDRHFRRMDAERAISSQPVAEGVDSIEVIPSSGCVFTDMGVERPVADGWLPIETAPKDGSEFLAWPCNTEKGAVVAKAYWYAHPSVQAWTTYEIDCGDYDFSPTHWRPLPATPEVAG